MISGTVEHIYPETNTIVVRRSSFETCTSCSSKGSCPTKIPDSEKTFIAKGFPGLKIGDTVTLEIQPGSRIIGSAIIFLFPLLMLLAGYFFGSNILHGNEPFCAGMSILFLIFSFFLIFAAYKKGLFDRISGTVHIVTEENAASGNDADKT